MNWALVRQNSLYHTTGRADSAAIVNAKWIGAQRSPTIIQDPAWAVFVTHPCHVACRLGFDSAYDRCRVEIAWMCHCQRKGPACCANLLWYARHDEVQVRFAIERGNGDERRWCDDTAAVL